PILPESAPSIRGTPEYLNGSVPAPRAAPRPPPPATETGRTAPALSTRAGIEQGREWAMAIDGSAKPAWAVCGPGHPPSAKRPYEREALPALSKVHWQK